MKAPAHLHGAALAAWKKAHKKSGAKKSGAKKSGAKKSGAKKSGAKKHHHGTHSAGFLRGFHEGVADVRMNRPHRKVAHVRASQRDYAEGYRAGLRKARADEKAKR